MPEITRAQAGGKIMGFAPTPDHSEQTINFGGFDIGVALTKDRRSGRVMAERGYGLIIQKGDNEFIVAGADASVVFIPDSPGPAMAGFEYIYEGEYIDGK